MDVLYNEDPNLPLALRGKVRDYLHYFPSWIRDVKVNYDSNLEGWAQSEHVQKYRMFKFVFGPTFINLSEEEQFLCVIHEIVHAHVMEYNTFTVRLLDAYEAEVGEKNVKVLRAIHDQAIETLVEDIAVILHTVDKWAEV